jgi:predicted PurR-regulated permease PerM
MSGWPWILGILCALSAINLNMAADARPDPNTIAFDTPLRRVFFTVVASLTLVLHLLLAVQFAGLIVPTLAAGLSALCLWWVRKRVTLYAFYRFSAVITLIAVAAILPSWQALYGDRDFGFRDVLAEEANDLTNEQTGQ